MSQMDTSPLKTTPPSNNDEKSQESSEDEDFLDIATDKDFLGITPGDANV